MFISIPLPEQTWWVLVLEIAYSLLAFAVCLRIIFDTRSVTKTLAYLMLVVFVPIAGIIFYFSFGINYRKRKIYSKKFILDESLKENINQVIRRHRKWVSQLDNQIIRDNKKLIRLLSNREMDSDLILGNQEVKIIQNGENLFPLIEAELLSARHHIHLEYYIYDNDRIGNRIKDILIQKAREGVEVRFIYDDFGSAGIRRNIARELRANGVKAYPFNKIRLLFLANRLNYRNHRKLIVIDGQVSFMGGINVADKYINNGDSPLFWRDTHLMIKGHSSLTLQQIFLSDWNFCSNEEISVQLEYFPITGVTHEQSYVQVISSGPDSDLPNILYSVLQAINMAKKEILITTPYYIPDSSLQEMLIIAALSGVEVKMLVPKTGDSRLVCLASESYFTSLLLAGVRIFRYTKGFVHAKTFVTDRKVASVGTANLDLRSFDLNFEVSALIYDGELAAELADTFEQDLLDAEEVVLSDWAKRGRIRRLFEKIVRLISPFM